MGVHDSIDSVAMKGGVGSIRCSRLIIRFHNMTTYSCCLYERNVIMLVKGPLTAVQLDWHSLHSAGHCLNMESFKLQTLRAAP